LLAIAGDSNILDRACTGEKVPISVAVVVHMRCAIKVVFVSSNLQAMNNPIKISRNLMSKEAINKLKPGTILDNKGLRETFGCSPQGGMRRSLETNTLVIVSNHVASIYDDRWVDDVLLYTGMGSAGDQSLEFAQNRTLSESNDNGVAVHLFEVFVEQEYTYKGQVTLSGKPYFESQTDIDGSLRNVCVFPLKLSEEAAHVLPRAYVEKAFTKKLRQAKRLTDGELERRATSSSRKPGTRSTSSLQYDRDPWVVEYAKRRANGVCQLCKESAPFNNNKGEPYLEVHHIVWLAKGGEDTPENTVALCPNCHRKMHVVDCKDDVNSLFKSVSGN
jgi:5-methylcytosine-specific restriction protein A